MTSEHESTSHSRRSFLAGVAATAVGVAFPLTSCHRAAPHGDESAGTSVAPPSDAQPVQMNAWVVIQPDNGVVLKIPQAEIGQGTFTALSQILADELDVNWADIRPEFYDPGYNLAHDNVYVWTATLGSKAIADLFTPARIAAATIRTLLVQSAGQSLGVSTHDLIARNGAIHHPGSGRQLRYADVAQTAAQLPSPPQESVQLKQANFNFIGKSMKRLDLPAKVDGSLVYGIDVRLPGMKYAAIRQCPVPHGRLKSYDASAVRARPGVVAILPVQGGKSGINDATPGWGVDYGMDDAVAVIADDWWTAKTALDALPIVWSEGKAASVSSQSLEREFKQTLMHWPKEAKPVRNDGNAAAAIAGAAKTLEREFWVPYTEQACLEPLNATARVDDNMFEVWAGTQFADEALRIAAHYAELPLEQGRLHLLPAGGGFGRRINSDFIAQAVQIAKATKGVPIKVIWSREEMIQHSFYPPLTVTRLKAGIDQSGKIVGWASKSVGGTTTDQTYGETRIPQTIPNVLVNYQLRETPLRFGWKRGVGFAQHTWMNQCFIDELAELAGRDPLEYQLSMLRSEDIPADFEKRQLQVERVDKQRRVLEELGRIAQWNQKLGPGRGKGLAVHDLSYWPEYLSTGAAAIAEVTLNRGELKIDRVVAVLDCGRVINPDSAKAQIEGGIAFGLTDALYSEITLARGRVMQSNFHDYPMLRMSEMPRIEVHFIDSDRSPEGLGEYGVPMAIAALVNAIRNAGGPRLYRLPLAPQLEKLRSAAAPPQPT
ncbi:xanthine dehydrogenase family protein molybdopterin-binding subunit [Comamonas humi]